MIKARTLLPSIFFLSLVLFLCIYLALPQIASTTLPLLLSRYGITIQDLHVVSMSPWKTVISPFNYCLDSVCLSSQKLSITYNVKLPSQGAEVAEVSLLDASLFYNPVVSSSPPEFKEKNLPSLPHLPLTGLPVDKIIFSQSNVSAPYVSQENEIRLLGSIERQSDGLHSDLTILGFDEELVLSLQSSTTNLLTSSFTLNKQIKADIAVSDSEWKTGQFKINVPPAAKSKLLTFVPTLMQFNHGSFTSSWNTSAQHELDFNGQISINDRTKTAAVFDWKSIVNTKERIKVALEINHQDSGISANAAVDATNNFQSGSFQYSTKLARYPVSFSKLPFFPIPQISLSAGQLGISGKINWGVDPGISTKLFATDLGGTYGGCAVSQGAGTLTLIGPKPPSEEISIAKIQCGLEINNIKAKIVPKYDNLGVVVVVMQDLRSDLLGGTLTVPKIEFGRPPYSIPVSITGASLRKVTELYKQEQIEADGIVDLVLPVTVSAQGASVTSGTLQSQGTGRIRYHNQFTDAALSNSLDVTQKALKDYNFNSLTGEVEYGLQGDLKLKVHLKGTSPALNTTRPVHVNLGIEQNIVSLFKSLKIADDIEHELQGLW